MKTPSLSLFLLLALTACDDGGDGDGDASTGDASGSTTDADSSPTDPTTETPTDPTGDTTTGDPDPTDPGTETGDPTDDPSDTDDPDDTDDTTGADVCDEEEGVPCEDQMILDLGLVSGTVSSGSISSTADGEGWVSQVDATAGGIVEAPNNPWTYLRFTDDGLEQVEVDDIEALTSGAWHIAAKRFGVRLNSGASGPGCVTVASLPDAEFDAVDAVPDDAMMRSEAFYDESCSIVDDGSGAGGANYALTPWWFYPGCVGVTYVPFVIALEDGRHVKFMVESYYESGQEACNTDGSMGMGSANFTWRWAFLD